MKRRAVLAALLALFISASARAVSTRSSDFPAEDDTQSFRWAEPNTTPAPPTAVSTAPAPTEPVYTVSSAGAEKKYIQAWDLGLSSGLRRDNFRFNIAGNESGTNPNILSELNWKHMDIYELRASGEFLTRQSIVIKTDVNYGWILGGDMRDSDYNGDNRTLEFSRSDNQIGGDYMLDASLGLGYRLKVSNRLSIVPLVGYAYDRQNLVEDSGSQTIPANGPFQGLHSRYDAEWKGFWTGAEVSYRLSKRWNFFTEWQYHWADYQAFDNHNLRTDLEHPKSFEHEANGNGIVGKIGVSYAYSAHWTADLTLDYENWQALNGLDTTFAADGSILHNRFNEADWDSTAVRLGLTYHFDRNDEFDEIQDEKTPNEPYAASVKMSGHYRLAAGDNFNDLILNDANADLQERNFRYLFGERLENTYDPAVYSRYELNVDFAPTKRVNVHAQMVDDPWSLVGQTGEQVQQSDIGGETIRYNLKYFGAFNSTLNEIYRTNVADSVAFPLIKVNNGQLTPGTVVHGFFDFNPGTGGIPFTIPALDIDYEYKPIRKLWVDYDQDDWHGRIFALADETQALTTDDPLQISNHKDYWQQSPWLYQYQPIQYFSDGSIKRGYYSDSLSFLARDSDGNRLVLLRGASMEADLGSTYFAGTVAAPITPWDDDYFKPDNIAGAFRLKHQASDELMVGSGYAFRDGYINGQIDAANQVVEVDGRYKPNDPLTFKSEAAFSRDEGERSADPRYYTDHEGMAYLGSADADFDHRLDGHTNFHLSYTWMDKDFDPKLSRYSDTRDDNFWGKHLSFTNYSPDLEAYRIGDGVDINRSVLHAQWREKIFKDRFYNLFDARLVHKADNLAFKEFVIRDEPTWQVTQKLTAKGLVRWQHLPRTTAGVEPFISDYYFIGYNDPSSLTFQNVDIPADKDPSRLTLSGALQYVFNKQWTAQGFLEWTNDVPDFPRGLLNSTFRDANDRVDGLLIDHLTNFLYDQGPLGGIPPYDYFTITRERILFRPDDRALFTLHAAQNGYKFAGPIDENINHIGLSLTLTLSKNLQFFFDYTHSNLIDVPRLISSGLTDSHYGGHDNLYASMDYHLNSATVFRAEYGVFGMGLNSPQVTPYSTTDFSLPTIDTEHLLRVSLTGDF